jgi:hypothetical protein
MQSFENVKQLPCVENYENVVKVYSFENGSDNVSELLRRP